MGGSLRTQRILTSSLVLVLAITLGTIAQSDAISRSYTWDYGGREWSITYQFPAAAYQLQSSLTRTLDYTSYHLYVGDPRDDEILSDFVTAIEDMAIGLNVWERLNLIISLVQSIPYVGESCEYPRYPLEMLVDGQGDCEDAAILAAALVQQMGFDVILLAFLQERHMAVGIRVLPPQHERLQAYEWDADLYYYLEPTGPGWTIGQRPEAYNSQPAVIGLPSQVARAHP